MEPVIIFLVIVVDERMIVALGALQIHPEKQTPDVTGHRVRLRFTVEQELARRRPDTVELVRIQQLTQ